ncbi:MAG: pyruvate kinase [SAR324 cluster bacterium]|nr:pyruvate kinase [SAR324 cluster bacterium]
MLGTKIICTIGPACDAPEMLEQLAAAGMNIARLNFSHGTHETHGRIIERVREMNTRRRFPTALLLDTQGPEIRTGELGIELSAGDRIRVTTPPDEERTGELFVNYPHLAEQVEVGGNIIVDSGLMRLRVLEKDGHALQCEALDPGSLGARRHVNLPGIAVKLPTITERDRTDILFGLEQDVDGIALSFVRSAAAIRDVRELLGKQGKHIKLIAKIENQEGVENLEEIVVEADGIMVARGDLGIEVDMEEVPQIQRRIAFLCATHGKRFIVATQLLESMIENPVPTRAEVTDIANAVYEQADAIMLSGETSTGKHPVRCVETLVRVARRTEAFPGVRYTEKQQKTSNRQHLAQAATTIASNLGMRGIVAITRFGRGAMYLSNWRPRNLGIYAFTNHKEVYRGMVFNRSVTPFMLEDFSNNPEVNIPNALRQLKQEGFESGDQVLVFADIFTGEGYVNSMQIRTIP